MLTRTQISLSEDDRRLLDAAAARTGRSVAALIREAVQATYGGRRDPDTTRRALGRSFGAWQDRELDGAAHVERIRSGRRLSGG